MMMMELRTTPSPLPALEHHSEWQQFVNPSDELNPAAALRPAEIDTYLCHEPPSELVSPMAFRSAAVASAVGPLSQSVNSVDSATTPTASVSAGQKVQAPRLTSVLLRNVYVAGLPIGFTDVHLAELLGQFGRLISCRMFNGSRKVECMGRSYGFGLFEQREDAEAAVQGLSSLVIEGRAIEIRLSDAHIIKKTKATRKAARGLDGQRAAECAATTPPSSASRPGHALQPPSPMHHMEEFRRGAPIYIANTLPPPPPPAYTSTPAAPRAPPPPYHQAANVLNSPVLIPTSTPNVYYQPPVIMPPAMSMPPMAAPQWYAPPTAPLPTPWPPTVTAPLPFYGAAV